MTRIEREKLQKELKELNKEIFYLQGTIAGLQSRLEAMNRKKSQLEMLLARNKK